jgi:RNA polymerase sigma factor (sigma-70 family)
MGYSDAEILQAIVSGNDRDALKFIYKTLFPKVKKYICDNSGNNEVAYDIFQDSMMVFYKYVITNRFDTKFEISAFIYSVCRNLWINQVRRDKREVVMPEFFDCSDNCEGVIEQLITREREEEVSSVLSQLGDRCEELLRYSVFYKLRNIEICQKMGFSTENAVKTRKYKCMQKLILLIESKPSLKKAIQEL